MEALGVFPVSWLLVLLCFSALADTVPLDKSQNEGSGVTSETSLEQNYLAVTFPFFLPVRVLRSQVLTLLRAGVSRRFLWRAERVGPSLVTAAARAQTQRGQRWAQGLSCAPVRSLGRFQGGSLVRRVFRSILQIVCHLEAPGRFRHRRPHSQMDEMRSWVSHLTGSEVSPFTN